MFLEDVDPATMTLAEVKTGIHKESPDIPITNMRLVLRTSNEESVIVHMDGDARTVASYGIVGSNDGDEIVTLQLLVVAPLTPEQIQERTPSVQKCAQMPGWQVKIPLPVHPARLLRNQI